MLKNHKRTPRTIHTAPVLKKQAPNEDILQRQIVAEFRAHGAFVIMTDAVGPALKFITDNTRRMGFISWSKARGWSTGIPDLLIVWKKNLLFLELKTPTGKGRLSEEQKIWRQKIIDAGYEYACWKTLDECTTWIAEHLNQSGEEDAGI